jgi:hypothetical protein
VEPQLRGPYKTEEGRRAAARRIRQLGDDDGVYRVDLTAPAWAGMVPESVRLSITPFSGKEVEAING